jgi:hypothetical protein
VASQYAEALTQRNIKEVMQGICALASSKMLARARHSFMDATSSGRLDKALAAIAEAPRAAPSDRERLRRLMKESFSEASSSGRLDEVLAASMQVPIAAPPDRERLRMQAKQCLVDASSSGKLDEALAAAPEQKSMQLPGMKANQCSMQAPCAAASDQEQVRIQAKQSFLEGLLSGKLSEAIAASQEAPELVESGSPRLNSNASFSDKLDEATATGQNKSQLIEAHMPQLRRQGQQYFSGESFSGKLDKPTTANLATPPVAPLDSHQVCMQAQQCFLAASLSGKLDEALAAVRKVPLPAESDLEQLRIQAKQRFLDASSSGKLDEILACWALVQVLQPQILSTSELMQGNASWRQVHLANWTRSLLM